jgi:hypothetical protein
MKDDVWSYIARETMVEGYGLREQARYYGRIIADEVVKGNLPVDDLAGCVAWAGHLARETAEVDSDGDQDEVLARRLLHSSTTTALKAVGDQRRRTVHRADYRRRCQLVTGRTNNGLFRLEAHDLGLNGLANLRGQVKLRAGKI